MKQIYLTGFHRRNASKPSYLIEYKEWCTIDLEPLIFSLEYRRLYQILVIWCHNDVMGLGNVFAITGYLWGESTSHGSLYVSFVLSPNKLLNKLLSCRWFQTSLRSCDVNVMRPAHWLRDVWHPRRPTANHSRCFAYKKWSMPGTRCMSLPSIFTSMNSRTIYVAR